VVQLYLQALDSLFVSFNDFQGYGGGILAQLRMGNSLGHILIISKSNLVDYADFAQAVLRCTGIVSLSPGVFLPVLH
jgi:hypothetical protein